MFAHYKCVFIAQCQQSEGKYFVIKDNGIPIKKNAK